MTINVLKLNTTFIHLDSITDLGLTAALVTITVVALSIAFRYNTKEELLRDATISGNDLNVQIKDVTSTHIKSAAEDLIRNAEFAKSSIESIREPDVEKMQTIIGKFVEVYKKIRDTGVDFEDMIGKMAEGDQNNLGLQSLLGSLGDSFSLFQDFSEKWEEAIISLENAMTAIDPDYVSVLEVM